MQDEALLAGMTIPGSGSLVIVPWEQYLIHNGRLFSIAHTIEGLPDGEYTDLIVQAGGKTLHAFSARWVCDGKAYLDLYGGTTYSGGEVLKAHNMYVGHHHKYVASFHVDPQIKAEGKFVHRQLLDGGLHPWRFKGEHYITYEWVLPANASVLVRITNASRADADISYQLNFYEGIYGRCGWC